VILEILYFIIYAEKPSVIFSLPSTVIEGLHNTFAHMCFFQRAACVNEWRLRTYRLWCQ